ncbi:Glycosyltransferase family 92 [Asanoa hainanensis]|uniref:Glycosyltransferase family 92 n=1 Tax=Asanoa hainanensis TaxID=560556 RepID=A0A239PH21_9ACTN|nr:glycosyltransferase family 2 protein [Asanoa hainanensis]SNT65888.1 Glycosyltransferase family 92 [Asanoa hainanensis]
MKLSVVAIARNETPYLLEWVAYQRVIGADRVIIYDNGHDVAGHRLLHALDRAGAIICVPWTGRFRHGPQVPAYEDALGRLRGTSDWVLFCDLDEFAVPVEATRLTDVLATVDDLDGMWLPWLIFGSSGELVHRPEPVIERFQRRQHADDDTVTPVKSVVRPARVVRPHLHVHHLDTAAYANPRGERDFLLARDGVSRRSAQLARGMDIVRIHHYMTKSQLEWRAKVARGRADRGWADESVSREHDEFAQWNRNEVRDATALRFLPALRQQMAALAQLTAGEDTSAGAPL